MGKPIIGLAGGIGSGKSHVARLFAELGCRVIDADELVHHAYDTPAVKATMRQWWGDEVFTPDGQINRAAIADKVFNNPQLREQLEHLLHPLVAERRDQIMRQEAEKPALKAFIWDAPLLFEAHLDRQCDAVVFVDAPISERIKRVADQRGWDRSELEKREKWQLPLDKKLKMSHYSIRNATDAEDIRSQVSEVLTRILAAGNAKERR